MAETNEKGEPHIPTALILRMQLGSGAYRLSAGTLTSAEREPISTPGVGRSRPCAIAGHQCGVVARSENLGKSRQVEHLSGRRGRKRTSYLCDVLAVLYR